MNIDPNTTPKPPVTEGGYAEMEKIRQQRGLPEMPPAATEAPLDFSTMRYLVETAVRGHALRCSARFRANKFTRVGEDFIDEVKADVEAVLRAMRNQCKTKLHEPLEPDENTRCVSGLLSAKLASEFNRLVCRIIQNKTQSQPSCGKTLGRTR